MEADVRGGGTRRPGRSAEGRNMANGAAILAAARKMARSVLSHIHLGQHRARSGAFDDAVAGR